MLYSFCSVTTKHDDCDLVKFETTQNTNIQILIRPNKRSSFVAVALFYDNDDELMIIDYIILYNYIVNRIHIYDKQHYLLDYRYNVFERIFEQIFDLILFILRAYISYY